MKSRGATGPCPVAVAHVHDPSLPFAADAHAVNTSFKVFWLDSARESNPGLPTFSTKITKFYCSKDLSVLFS